MDDSVFEVMFRDMGIDKLSTEQCLTNYYKILGNNLFKAAEFAESNNLNFVEFVNKSIKKAHLLNVPYVFNFASKDVVIVNNSYFKIKKIQTNLGLMEWRDFESISGIILENCFGAIDVKITQATADGGLDFEGKIPIKSVMSDDKYGIIEVYGQSKKYSSNVGIYDIKSFVAFANSKKRNYVHPAQLFMFFTSSDFANNAWTEIKENGFIGFSGLQLANLIYNHKVLLANASNLFTSLLND